MQNLIQRSGLTQYSRSAGNGNWHTGLGNLGFDAAFVDEEGLIVIPVNEDLRYCEPEEGKKVGSFSGIWHQVEKIAVRYITNKKPAVPVADPVKIVFRIREDQIEREKETNRIIKIFNPNKLSFAVRKELNHMTKSEIVEQYGFSRTNITRWLTGRNKNCRGTNQGKLHRLLGDRFFTHGLDIDPFRKRQELESRKHGSLHAAATKLNVNESTFLSWMRFGKIPTMYYHQRIYDTYGVQRF